MSHQAFEEAKHDIYGNCCVAWQIRWEEKVFMSDFYKLHFVKSISSVIGHMLEWLPPHGVGFGGVSDIIDG